MQQSKAVLLLDESPNGATFVANLLGRNQVEAKIRTVDDLAGFNRLDELIRWDVVIAKSRPGWMDAQDLLRAVRRRWGAARIVLVIESPDEAFVAEVLRQGLADFVASIQTDFQALEEAVLAALTATVQMPGRDETQSQLARSPAGFFRCSPAGRLFDCNNALARMLGFEDRVQVLMANRPLVSAEHLKTAKLRLVRPGDKLDLRLEHREGRVCWGRLLLWPIVLPDGRPAGYEGWVQDVTQRRWHLERLRQHRETYHTLLDFSPVATAIFNTEGVVQQVNAEFERLAGTKQEELRGVADYFSFVAPADVERVKRAHLARIAGKNPPARYEYDFVSRRGEVRRIQLTAHFMASRRCTVVHHVDLTERNRKETAFKQLAMGLAEECPDVLRGLVVSLARALKIESVVLAQTVGPEGCRLEMPAGWLDGRPHTLPSLPVAASAFAKLLAGRSLLLACTENARASFPADPWLQTLGAEGFVGLPIFFGGGPVGLLAVVSRRPVSNIRFLKSVMQIVVQRATTEIARRLKEPAENYI